VAAVDWFPTEVAAPPSRRTSRPRPRAAPHRRAEGRRLRGGIVWIALFAVLLVGVVAVNVAVLRANMALSNLNQKQLQLESQNQTLASQVSSAGSSLRIEQAAHRLGLVPAPAADTNYLDLARR
jgi:cell division protein FtsL